jgi:hypothetical protein
VEASYEKERRLRDERLGIPQLESLIPRLGTSPAPNADLIPAQDPATTASVNGKVITSILSIIARKQMRYVGIIASDPRDMIFLASSIREHCPDVQMFIVGSDLFFSLPEYSYYLRGTIVGSTYPLVTANQRWTKPDASIRLVFSDQQTQGYYNAIQAQLKNYNQMIEYRPPAFQDRPRRPGEEDRPPIWITMIGQDGDLVPLQIFSEYKDDSYVWPPPGMVQNKEPFKKMGQPFPGTAAIALGAVCIFAAVVLYYAFRHRSPQLFWQVPKDEGRSSFRWGMAYRIVCLVSLGILLFPIAHLCAIHLKDAAPFGMWWLSVVLVLMFFLLGLVSPALFLPFPPAEAARQFFGRHWLLTGIVCASVLCATVFGWYPWAVVRVLPWFFLGLVGPALLYPLIQPPSRFWQDRRAWVGVACLGVVLLAFLGWDLSDPPNSREAFFFYRSLHFTSGVSLVLPLFFLCAVFFCWALFQMKGRRDSRYFSVSTPYPDPGPLRMFDVVRERGRELTDEVRSFLLFASRHRIELTILLILLIAGSIRLSLLFLPTVEGPFWTWLLFCGITLGSLLVAVNVLRFLALWSRFKSLCHEISLIPMTGAFSRLPAKVTSVFGGYLKSLRPRLSHLRVPLHQLRLLRQEMEQLLGEGLRANEVALCMEMLAPLSRELAAFEREVARDFPGMALPEYEVPTNLPEPPRPPGELLTTAGEQARAKALRARLSDWSQRLLTLLPTFWARRSVDEAFGSADGAGSPRAATSAGASQTGVASAAAQPDGQPAAAHSRQGAAPGRFAHWVELAEGFVATQVVIYISQFFVQLRNLVWPMAVCSVLLLLAATSYPFQPQRLILYTMLALIGAVVAAILYVLIMVNRDELVSRIAGTTPNRFTLDAGFISSVFTYVVPVVSIVALQLSGAFRFMLEPILRVLK